MEKITSVIFDFDYTLVDSSSGSIECVSWALKRMNLPVPSAESIRKTIGLSLEDIITTLTQARDQQSAREFRRLFTIRADEVMLERTFLLEGVKQTLGDLHQRNLGLGIVSNKYRYRIETFLARENLNKVIDIVVGSEDAPRPKPDPAGLLMALKKLGGSPNKTVYAGDSLVDAETARRLELPFIAVLTGVTPRADFYKYSPYRIIHNLTELPSLLQ